MCVEKGSVGNQLIGRDVYWVSLIILSCKDFQTQKDVDGILYLYSQNSFYCVTLFKANVELY